jgi:class 3 adenylate cyclase
MLQRFAPVATRWRDEFAVVIGIGIGLHLGEVALGFLGPPGKQAITMIGDTANVAARLCGRARAGEVLFSCAIAAALSLTATVRAWNRNRSFSCRNSNCAGVANLLDIWCLPAPGKVAH